MSVTQSQHASTNGMHSRLSKRGSWTFKGMNATIKEFNVHLWNFSIYSTMKITWKSLVTGSLVRVVDRTRSVRGGALMQRAHRKKTSHLDRPETVSEIKSFSLHSKLTQQRQHGNFNDKRSLTGGLLSNRTNTLVGIRSSPLDSTISKSKTSFLIVISIEHMISVFITHS